MICQLIKFCGNFPCTSVKSWLTDHIVTMNYNACIDQPYQLTHVNNDAIMDAI